MKIDIATKMILVFLFVEEQMKVTKIIKSVFKARGPKYKYENFTSMPYARSKRKTAVINSELFVLGGYSQNNPYDKSVRKFCNKTKT